MTIIAGTVNQDGYTQKLTEDEDRCFILQEDGASCHTGAYARWWKESHQIKKFEYWSAQSPDLNPIEQPWWALERGILSANTPAQNIFSLKAVIEEQ
ncbi:MAG: transposase [Paenibacillus sp.]|nr:transposase [Paenibacillus sp.]